MSSVRVRLNRMEARRHGWAHRGLVAFAGVRANHIVVYGQVVPAGSAPLVAEAWDFADVDATGQERYLHVVEPLITTVAAAGIRAGLERAVEQRRALAGTVSVALNPGLELGDVVQFTDGLVGPVAARLRVLLHLYDAGHPRYALVLELEGV